MCMSPACGSVAHTLLGVLCGLRAAGSSAAPRVLLTAAAVGLLVAGVFPFGRATVIHVAAVVPAFAFVVLAMYLTPPRAGRLRSSALWAESWLLATGAVAGAAAAGFGVPFGVAQRLATACVLGWLC